MEIFLNLGLIISFRDLFDQDSVKMLHDHDEGVGKSLHRLVKEMGGAETIAKGLECDLVVSKGL